MPKITFKDVTMIYPFTKVTGLFDRKAKELALKKQKEMPYTSNEGVIALQHFDATINDGEFVVIVGPSGSGKTTVLRLIAGLERPSVGEIYFNKELVNDIKPEDRDIAMVFQNFALYPNLNVYQNICFPLSNLHLPREEIEEKVDYIVSLLHLEDKLMRLPDELSGGEKQRVAIARALVKRPKIFLLDEPFSNLDVLMRQSLRREIKMLQKELKTTFIYVTHDQTEALQLADRIILLKDGIKEQDDLVYDFYNYPNSIFAGEFIGFPKMNIFENIKVEQQNKRISFRFMEQTYRFDLAKSDNIKTVSLGIRPVNITIGDQGVEAIVEYEEMIGADLIIHTKVNDQEVLVVEKNDELFDMKYMNGQVIYLNFDKDFFHLFGEDGKRIETK